ncbi:MAG TPA: erythromycin esterase family protein [Azospirillaceae bacterium]|nr:erythromycin esterase family protein [Azospirillaceae bacterium]
MYHGSAESWNLRDTHMAETLALVMRARSEGSKAVMWAHNSHIGDASATEMSWLGEVNLGQLTCQRFGANAVALVGFGTDRGTAVTPLGGAVIREDMLPETWPFGV